MNLSQNQYKRRASEHFDFSFRVSNISSSLSFWLIFTLFHRIRWNAQPLTWYVMGLQIVWGSCPSIWGLWCRLWGSFVHMVKPCQDQPKSEKIEEWWIKMVEWYYDRIIPCDYIMLLCDCRLSSLMQTASSHIGSKDSRSTPPLLILINRYMI